MVVSYQNKPKEVFCFAKKYQLVEPTIENVPDGSLVDAVRHVLSSRVNQMIISKR